MNRGFTFLRSKKANPLLKYSNSGFTLVEILVVIAVIAIIGTILVAIFTNTLKGSSKSQILSVIKQNGQAVLENMDKTVRGADDVVCPFVIPPVTTADSTNLVILSGGIYTRYRFTAPTGTDNGLIQQDNPIKQTDVATGKEETDTAFFNRVCTPDDPMTQLTQISILTDANPQMGVSVENGLFTRRTEPGFKDSVTVKFTLGPGTQAPSTVTGQIDPVNFQTTVQLR